MCLPWWVFVCCWFLGFVDYLGVARCLLKLDSRQRAVLAVH